MDIDVMLRRGVRYEGVNKPFEPCLTLTISILIKDLKKWIDENDR